jgi:hypothetical protein
MVKKSIYYDVAYQYRTHCKFDHSKFIYDLGTMNANYYELNNSK